MLTKLKSYRKCHFQKTLTKKLYYRVHITLFFRTFKKFKNRAVSLMIWLYKLTKSQKNQSSNWAPVVSPVMVIKYTTVVALVSDVQTRRNIYHIRHCRCNLDLMQQCYYLVYLLNVEKQEKRSTYYRILEIF